MTDEQINAAIAEACGWTQVNTKHRSGRAPNAEYVGSEFIPNYCRDLNAMHEAERVLVPRSWNNFSENWWNYSRNLACISDGRSIHATARQRAEAFLRTLGKWEEVQK